LGDLIADLFYEANMKSQTPYVSFHKRDYSKQVASFSNFFKRNKNNEFLMVEMLLYLLIVQERILMVVIVERIIG
jgi:hypothetical protein